MKGGSCPLVKGGSWPCWKWFGEVTMFVMFGSGFTSNGEDINCDCIQGELIGRLDNDL